MWPLYNLLWYLVVPALPLRLWWRGRREPGYRRHIAERFGRFGHKARHPLIWVHAVSLGETHAARPLLERLEARYPQATILLTHMTATGRGAGRALGMRRVMQAWLPYDVPPFVHAFLRHFRPAAGIILETEVWPNLMVAARSAAIPVYLVNARLSQRSARRYERVRGLAREAFGGFSGIAAQTSADALRIAALGGPKPVVTGSLKFDVTVKPEALALGAALRERFGGTRPVWLAASTRDGEEALLLEAWSRVQSDALLVLVPRHPQRFGTVAQLLHQRGIAFARRTQEGAVEPNIAVVLGDSMGEMSAYCAAADVVLMGGSLLPLGGQNLIEPIALGKPTIVGPHMFNFAGPTQAALAAGAAIQVRDAQEAVSTVQRLLADPGRRADMSAAARAFHAREGGAADRLWEWLAPKLDEALAANNAPRRA